MFPGKTDGRHHQTSADSLHTLLWLINCPSHMQQVSVISCRQYSRVIFPHFSCWTAVKCVFFSKCSHLTSCHVRCVLQNHIHKVLMRKKKVWIYIKLNQLQSTYSSASRLYTLRIWITQQPHHYREHTSQERTEPELLKMLIRYFAQQSNCLNIMQTAHMSAHLYLYQISPTFLILSGIWSQPIICCIWQKWPFVEIICFSVWPSFQQNSAAVPPCVKN